MKKLDVNEARKVAHLTAVAARHAAALDRHEEAHVREAQDQTRSGKKLRSGQRKALLIINSKSGRKHDSLLHIRELVELLRKQGITTDVRVKLSKAQARMEARGAARRGCGLVVAAGGDGTVEAVARGLVGSKTALGIIPLGTYNNVATSLGVPTEPSASVALISSGVARAIDVGEVDAHGSRRTQLFLELATVGVGAALMPIGQNLEKGRWRAAATALPDLLTQTPARVDIRLDGAPRRRLETLLLMVSNAPRSGAGLMLAPAARMDDGLLDLSVFEDLGEAGLALRWRALATGEAQKDSHLHTARALSIRIRSDRPLPVAADSRLVGTTPVRMRVRAGALLVIAGRGPALSHPATQEITNITTGPRANGWLAFLRGAAA